jgi:predicted alpha/beta superfamily hydrolase
VYSHDTPKVLRVRVPFNGVGLSRGAGLVNRGERWGYELIHVHMNRTGYIVLALSACAAAAYARSPAREVLSFSVATNTGLGRSEFVVGSHSDVGNWSPSQAVKLYWTAGNVWTGHIAIQSGTTLEYKFVTRATTSGLYCSDANVEWMSGANLTSSVPAQPAAPYTGKTVYYHSGWTNAFLVYRVGTNWFSAEMSRAGAGRGAGEYLYRLGGIGEAGEDIEFIPGGYSGGVQYWDHAPYGGYGDSNYYTTLDVFFLQDGHVFNYWPPVTVSVSRIETTNVTSSWAPTIPSRNIRIYVPRGYDQNTWKRYPVLYMHDGQNVFQPGGVFGCWNGEQTADKEISQGRMRETIIVAVDNTSARNREYIPPDGDAGAGPGTGDQYADFLIHNVRPTVDTHYRTLNDRANTLTVGSSFGGLISTYLGLETNVFGMIGPMSPAYWPADAFVGRIDSNNIKGVRIYTDMGTDESETSMWDPFWRVYDLFLADGYALNDDLRIAIGCGQQHNEAAWAARLPGAYDFLLNVWDEPNVLAQAEYPPAIETVTSEWQFSFHSLRGRAYRLDRTPSLVGGSWSGVTTSAVENLPWSSRTLADTNAPAQFTNGFYRLVVEPWP